MGDGNGLFADALAFFAANFLTDVANAFALVRLGWIEAANFGSELTDELLVDSFDLDLGVLNDSDAETGSSLARETTTVPSSLVSEMPSGSGKSSLPFGPSTITVRPSSLTATFAGTEIGLSPTRDMVLVSFTS